MKLTEMDKPIILLKEADIPFEIHLHTLTMTPMIIYPSRENWICDVIYHKWSYGYKEGLLEMMGLIPGEYSDEVEGYLTAETVFDRILNHYERKKLC
jgi:hypothetical protein